MNNNWFRVPEVGSGTTDDGFRPKYSDQCESWAATKLSFVDSQSWLARFYADQSTLDDIANNPDAIRLWWVPADSLNRQFGRNETDAEWQDRFNSG